ncbi:TetR/AcrR family transcriptional regulator [Endozoicomonas sp. SESOKO1]|uniref:TetR/AcrR family transcriptional regulator n=1 Tax=Endozoicomonas sp. SESOKO1 TaxID=2828742 RepID=UPI0021497AD8
MTRSERKRRAILDAAKEEFIQYGFLGANMDRVCTAAEVSKRTLYRHFASKELLFESVLTILQASAYESVSYPFDPELSLHTQLTSISLKEAEILYQIYGIPLSRTIVMEFLRQPDMARNLINTLYSTKAVTQWFREAMEAGKLNEMDLSVMTNIYISLFQGMLFWPQVVKEEPVPEGRVLEDIVEIVVSTVLSACARVS